MLDVGVVDVGNDGLDGDGGVDPGQLAAGGLGLGQVVGDVLLVEQRLPLQVVQLDEVAVDDPQTTPKAALPPMVA